MSFREIYRRLTPKWQHDDEEGAPLLYSIGLLLDACQRHYRLALLARYPGPAQTKEGTVYAPADALQYIARDRRIERGRGETSQAFAARLNTWLDDHKTRGNPYALMRQLRAYLGVAVRIRTVDNSGNWYTIEADGTLDLASVTAGTAFGWDWDGQAAQWSRFWAIIYPTAAGEPWSEGPAWGDPGLVWGTPGATWGTTATVGEVEAVRRIVRDWKPAGTRCEHIIIAFDDASFDPTGPTDLPTGDWGSAANRLATARYWRGTRNAS